MEAFPTQGAAAAASRAKDRVHIAIGPVCNNNCIFCMEEDREARRRLNALTPDQVRTILQQNTGAEEVCFTSGEPTLVDALPRYVAKARELHYPRISMMTNARRLAYRDYCRSLVRAGLNLLYVSIHAHTAPLHNRLVRTANAFEQTIAGLSNASELRAGGLRIHTSTVVTRRNLPYLYEMYTSFRQRGADQVVFNGPQPNGRAETNFEAIFPRYSDVVSEMVKLLQRLEEPSPPVYLVDVPPCATQRVAPRNRGWVEPYKHHEPDADQGLVEKRRTDFDQERRQQGPPCERCALRQTCPGVWHNYLKRHGWAEFVPLTTDGT